VSILELCRGTCRSPGGSRAALDDRTLSVDAGELVVIAGASGSGKSTLLRAASGLVPHFHGGELAGRVSVAGMDTREHGPGELASVVGTLFQDPETQIVMGTVRAELGFPLENRGHGAPAVARAVEETALALGIAHLLDRPTAELSGGELQRVALAAALAGKPSLIVLDEPTSQLDPVAGDELMGLLRRINEDFDATILLVEHRLERCLPAADRVIAMAGGRVVCDAPPATFLEWAGGAAPALSTPGGRLLRGLGLAPVAGVKAARAALRARRIELDAQSSVTEPPVRATRAGGQPALAFERVWHELRDGPAILRAVSLTIAPGERVALMGRNGAGKTTLLRGIAGRLRPYRGRLEVAGPAALVPQSPGDLMLRERVRDELPGVAGAAALAAVGLEHHASSDPRDLSGGERQRLALGIVMAGRSERRTPPIVCLDEPTRGMDRARKDRLAERLRTLADAGAAVVVATHDTEFAAHLADRVVLMGQGIVIADAPAHEVLAGGWQFATDTARVLGEQAHALTPDEGAAVLARELVR